MTLIYHSPSQSSVEFQTFLRTFDLFLNNIANLNPFVSIISSDFNERPKKLCFINKATYEDKKPESVTSQCGLKQVVSDPTHMQPSSVMNPGVHPLLHRNCHHQIIHTKFNLKIFYLLSYE